MSYSGGDSDVSGTRSRPDKPARLSVRIARVPVDSGTRGVVGARRLARRHAGGPCVRRSTEHVGVGQRRTPRYHATRSCFTHD